MSTLSDPWAAAAAAFAGISAIFTVREWFKPDPMPAEEARQRDDRIKRSFAAADSRAGDRHEETLDAIARDKHEHALAEIIAGNANEDLLIRYRKALAIERADGSHISPRDAAEFAVVASRTAENDDPRFQEISRLIEDGELIEAADRKAALAEDTAAAAARHLRDAARLVLPVSPAKALEHFTRATQLDPSDVWAWIALGRLRAIYDNLDSAENCFKIALQHVGSDRDRSVLYDGIGNILLARGVLAKAQENYEAGLAIRETLVSLDGSNAQWRGDLEFVKRRTAALSPLA